MGELRLVDAEPSGSVVFEIAITDVYANLNGAKNISTPHPSLGTTDTQMIGVMHGGAAGVMFGT